ncbi:MAG: hypothetical protein MR412_00095 [Firmicutes bacterium]|nr:hypothetical protein [Bacillota bacterium]MDY5677011.1 hypothetical protein [Eubacteriales bacterium]
MNTICGCRRNCCNFLCPCANPFVIVNRCGGISTVVVNATFSTTTI